MHPEASEDRYTGSTAEDWTVWREDDDGNRFIVKAALAYDEAVALVSTLEARGHKQVYWLQEMERS